MELPSSSEPHAELARRVTLGPVRSARDDWEMEQLAAVVAATTEAQGDWLSRNSTLIVGIVGIIVSGLLGPAVAALLTARRERQKDKRELIASRRDDLRALLDEAAAVLGRAVANLRPLLEAEQAGRAAPREPAEFLGTLFPLGQRLSLRLPPDHEVVTNYHAVRTKLIALSKATASQGAWEAAVSEFESVRAGFLDAGRAALQAPMSEKQEI